MAITAGKLWNKKKVILLHPIWLLLSLICCWCEWWDLSMPSGVTILLLGNQTEENTAQYRNNETTGSEKRTSSGSPQRGHTRQWWIYWWKLYHKSVIILSVGLLGGLMQWFTWRCSPVRWLSQIQNHYIWLPVRYHGDTTELHTKKGRRIALEANNNSYNG